MIQRTFSIIKPDAVKNGNTGGILAEMEKGGFKIVSIRKQSISKKEAEGFYAVHAAKGFFDSLTTFMSSGPLVLMVLEKENAIADLRKLMGATNPANADGEERFARSLRSRLSTTRSTDRMRRRRPRLRSDIGSQGTS